MILVTGGAGFIGSHLVARLAAEGERVCVLDRLGHGDKWRNLAKHEVDEIVAPEGLEEFGERRREDIDIIFHMGAVSSTTETDADLVWDTNVRLSQRIWRACAQHGWPLVYASSAATYGDGSRGFSDRMDRKELAELRPLNPYGWSKHAFDRWVLRELAEGGARPPAWAGLKFFNVYGPNEYHKGDMRSVVAKAYPRVARGEPVTLFRSHHPDYPDGGQMRDFVYVKDCVDVMLWLRDHPEVDGIFNVGTGRARTWLDLMRALHDATGRELQVEWVDTPEHLRDRYQYFTEAEMDKLRAEGYDADFTSLEEGVGEYVRDYLVTDDPYF